MSKDSIRLSEKHGLNPSMLQCFYCGETIGIALVGKYRTKDDPDAEAPKFICNSVEPCDACKEKYKDYVLMVEKPDVDSNPTGRWFAIKKEVLNPAYRNTPVAFMLTEDFNKVLSDFNHHEEV